MVAEVVGLDQSAEMLEQACLRLASAGLSATLLRGDAYALPFEAHTFDGCFLGFFLSHVPLDRVAGFLGQVRRVLRPGGQLLVFDSLVPPGRDAMGIEERTLNDGSSYRMLKVYHTAASLANALATSFDREAISTEDMGRFFVVGRAVA